ncbi:class I SAM-dependent methyltransferase [Curtobacterium pusillum]|uniref:class I SAM-dependent methyltransferase n=1 Tax=Curtobacterium pusillum TaxID=69373 RepID=UPI0011A5D34E|nr:class I SAM-dependent methyltransferase [Curtobacterium pusillum]
MPSDVEGSYSRRAAEYTAALGSIATVHPSDLALVTSRASSVVGPLLDAGCGPGHWTAHLASQCADARGVDRVPAFIEHARAEHPTVPFTVGDIDALADPDEGYGGVLAWYSLIHHEPDAVRRALDEFARVLRPGGQLLVGFFLGAAVDPFDHAVVTAYRWPAEALAGELDATGFAIVETHTRIGAAARPRPHGAITAVLR